MDQKDQDILYLLDSLRDPDKNVSFSALENLIKMPISNFQEQDLIRLKNCDVPVFKAFAEIMLVKFDLEMNPLKPSEQKIETTLLWPISRKKWLVFLKSCF
jgi:hypothetical protein